ncbi:MAG: hypothetical protein N2712_03585 [Brevinematales bacterium]|nr:hypothetical protein [Brevinematales bacterium]
MQNFLVLLLLLLILAPTLTFAEDNVSINLAPVTLFFADAVGIGTALRAEVEIGVSKFSSSDYISIAPETSFVFSQSETSSFSIFSIKLATLYNFLIYSFEKKNNLYIKAGTITGIGIQNASITSTAFSFTSISLVFEPTIGINYNFVNNMWIGLDIRYTISSDINNKITTLASPTILIPFSVKL